jgi:hypothetical protein
MCVLLAYHFKVHATIEKGLADEQGVFADFFCSWRRLYLLLAASVFSSCMCLLMSSVAKGPKFQPQNFLNSW